MRPLFLVGALVALLPRMLGLLLLLDAALEVGETLMNPLAGEHGGTSHRKHGASTMPRS